MDEMIKMVKSIMGYVTYVDRVEDGDNVSYVKHEVFSIPKLAANFGVAYLVARA